jgi:stringent starvation protein B
MAIYAQETSEGMMFDPEPQAAGSTGEPPKASGDDDDDPPPGSKGPGGHLKLVE